MPRPGDHDGLVGAQGLEGEARAEPLRAARQQHVQAAGGQLVQQVRWRAFEDLQLQLRMAIDELGQHGGEQAGGGGRDCAHPQQPARAGLQRRERLERDLQGLQSLSHHRQHDAAGLADPYAACLALEQRHLEQAFELADGLGGGGLADADLFGGTLERAMVGHGQQQLQVAQPGMGQQTGIEDTGG